MTRPRRGGTISELLAGVVALALLAGLILPAAARFRHDSRTASSLSQLRWMAGATSSYAADSADRSWSFWWKAGPLPSAYPDLQFASTDFRAAGMQATDILRRLSGRDMPLPTLWFPHVLYNHLPLVDYLKQPLPDFRLVAPADRYRLAWARDPHGFDRGELLPFQPDPGSGASRWPYTSSYLPPVTWWDTENVVYQGTRHSTFSLPGTARFAGVVLADVAFPSQKVLLHDQEQRELGGRGLYCLDADARVAMLMADGSAGVRSAPDSNPGWNPASAATKRSGEPSRFLYEPSAWEAPPAAGEILHMTGHYRYTRGGIKGRDFGGPEVDTGQP